MPFPVSPPSQKLTYFQFFNFNLKIKYINKFIHRCVKKIAKSTENDNKTYGHLFLKFKNISW